MAEVSSASTNCSSQALSGLGRTLWYQTSRTEATEQTDGLKSKKEQIRVSECHDMIYEGRQMRAYAFARSVSKSRALRLSTQPPQAGSEFDLATANWSCCTENSGSACITIGPIFSSSRKALRQSCGRDLRRKFRFSPFLSLLHVTEMKAPTPESREDNQCSQPATAAQQLRRQDEFLSPRWAVLNAHRWGMAGRGGNAETRPAASGDSGPPGSLKFPRAVPAESRLHLQTAPSPSPPAQRSLPPARPGPAPHMTPRRAWAPAPRLPVALRRADRRGVDAPCTEGVSAPHGTRTARMHAAALQSRPRASLRRLPPHRRGGGGGREPGAARPTAAHTARRARGGG
jgi:hypothetical protein